MTPYTYSARVERIVDGDTCDLTCDVGFRIYHKARFRLYGIDTPERGQPGWAEATAHLTSLIPIGVNVTVRSHRPDAHPKDAAQAADQVAHAADAEADKIKGDA